IDGSRIGIMGFSKGGATTLLAIDQRFASVLSKTGTPFALHIAIYPGCQVFPENPRVTDAPVRMLLGEKDNFTGISGCYEIEAKLKGAGAPVDITVYRGAFHSWDEDFQPIRINDLSSEDCRWMLKDGGGVWGGGIQPLNTTAEAQAYVRSCMKV